MIRRKKRDFMFEKKNIFGISVLALLCGINASPAFSAQKKKSSGPSTACLTCLNAFSPNTLKFTITPAKCTKILAACDKTDRTSSCEPVIQDCLSYNCSELGSCTKEKANRALIYGCLKSENKFLPYQCASYIKGYASSKASEANAALDTAEAERENQAKQAQYEAERAASQAKTAAAEAATKQKQIEAQAQTEQAQIEAQSKLAQQQKAYELEKQQQEDKIAREKKAALEARNNKPNVKYNNLLSEVKKDISTAKTYSTKAFNLLGITKTTDSQRDYKDNALFFPPRIVSISGLSAYNDAKTRALINGSRYKEDTNFVCTKDTKESYIKNELNNIYKTVKKSNEKLSNGIAEIEATIADDENTSTISETKLNNLYEVLNKLTEIMNNLEIKMSDMKTSCETRCKGMSTINTNTKVSSHIEFDENGNIIEDKTDDSSNTYSCKDFDNDSSSSMDFSALLSGKKSAMSDMFGGVGKKVSDLTFRVTEAVVETDKALEETNIAIQGGKFGSGNSEYPAIDSCVQYMVLDIASYTSCVSNILGQQLLALSKNKTNSTIRRELNSSIKTVKTTIQSPNYTQYIGNEKLYCENRTKGELVSQEARDSNLNDFEDFNNCVLSITNALNKVKDKKDKTGQFNFQITDAQDIPEQIYTYTGSYTPKDFASKLLNWENISTCSLRLKYKESTINYYGGTTKTETNLDFTKSGISCQTINNNSCFATFLSINNGSYSDCGAENR